MNQKEKVQISIIYTVYSFFQILDSSDDGSGGNVSITEGGIGYRFIEIGFNSLIGRGLDYVIMIFKADPFEPFPADEKKLENSNSSIPLQKPTKLSKIMFPRKPGFY